MPGTSQSWTSWRGRVPARRRRILAGQSTGCGSGEAAAPASLALPSVSATAARAAFDAAPGEIGGVEEPCELLTRQIGHLFRHLAHGLAFGISLLGDGRALLV